MVIWKGGAARVSCTVDRVGSEYVCSLLGDERGAQVVARSTWRGDRAVTEQVGGDAGREAEVATLVAHRLCKSVRHPVVCVVDLPAESMTDPALDLATQAARQLEEHRLRESTQVAGGLLTRLHSGGEELSARVAALMSTPLDELLEAKRPIIAEAHERFFGRKIRLFAPLYLSDACLNDCAYCGFRKSASIDRKKLPLEQVVDEANRLVERGHFAVDLVTGEIPTESFVDYVCEAIEHVLGHTGIRHISLNLGALSTDQLRRLRSAGATAYHLYMETYDPATYLEVHERGPKRDMSNRADGLHRALEAGFELVSLGVLLGLRPLEDELVCLARHAQILSADHPSTRLGFSLPRLRTADADCHFRAPVSVSDEQFVKAMIFMRLEFPRAHLTLTTREGREIRDALIPLGITKISAGVSTAPGGYGAPQEEVGQFSVSDQRTPGEVAEAIRAAGMEVDE